MQEPHTRRVLRERQHSTFRLKRLVNDGDTTKKSSEIGENFVHDSLVVHIYTYTMGFFIQ